MLISLYLTPNIALVLVYAPLVLQSLENSQLLITLQERRSAFLLSYFNNLSSYWLFLLIDERGEWKQEKTVEQSLFLLILY